MTAPGAPDLSEEQVSSRQARAARRRAQPGRLRTASSFPQPLGERFARGGVRGYYIDLRAKAEASHWPPDWWLRHAEQQYIGVSQWGLGCYERYLAGEGEAWLQAARNTADYLLDHQGQGGAHAGAWLHLWAYPHTFRLHPPWPSAMAQGEAASLLVRMYLETGEERLAAAARLALRPLAVPTGAGGVRAQLDGHAFPEELPTEPPSYILNGAIFALFGYHDVGVGLGDAPAFAAFQAGADMLASTIHRWDTGWWSRYDLYHHRLDNLANPFYHCLHIDLLRAMQRLAPRPQVEAAIGRFERYAASPVARAAVYGHKAAFRVQSPRSPRLAAAARRLGDARGARDAASGGERVPTDEHTVAYFDRTVPEYGVERLATAAALMRRHVAPRASLLDIGCGTGNTLAFLRESTPVADVAGLDVSERCLASARASTGCETHAGSILDAGLAARLEGRFDVVTVAAVLHHLIGPTRTASRARAALAVRHAARMLRPGGHLIVLEPTFSRRRAMTAAFYLKKAVTAVTASRVPIHDYWVNVGAPVVAYYRPGDVAGLIGASPGLTVQHVDSAPAVLGWPWDRLIDRRDTTVLARRDALR